MFSRKAFILFAVFLFSPFVASASCTLDGVTVLNYKYHTFYSAQTVPYGTSCSTVDQSRECLGGRFGGSSAYKYSTCSPAAPISCTQDGLTFASGSSKTFYLQRSVAPGQVCSSESRTCTNGTLSGTYPYKACVVGGDTTPPTVSLTDPATDALVSGMIVITGAATDPSVSGQASGVAGVQFKVDGTSVGPEDTSSPYSVSWNTASVGNGSHTITATARDVAGNVATSAIVTVTVNNAAGTSIFNDALFTTGQQVIAGLVEWHTRVFKPSDKMTVAPYDTRLHGMRRKVMVVQSATDPNKTETYLSEALSFKMCDSLEFLVDVSESPVIDTATRTAARTSAIRYADDLIGEMQIQTGPFTGGFRLSEIESGLSSKTAAHCGSALVKAWHAYGSSYGRYLQAALSAGKFLQKMEEPRLFGGKFSSFLFKTANGTASSIGMWMDEADPDTGKIVVASALWNARAIELYDELDRYADTSWIRESAPNRERSIAVYTQGALSAYTGYSPDFQVDDTSVVQIAGSILNSNKAGWQRGSGGVPYAIGSDMPEHVIVALNAIGDSRANQIYDLYNNAIQLEKVGSNYMRTSDGVLDAFVGWGLTYFVGGSIDANNIYHTGSGSTLYMQHTGYDFDAITAETRARLYPHETLSALAKLLAPQSLSGVLTDSKMGRQSHWLYAVLDRNLKPYKSLQPGFLDNKELSYLNGSGNTITWQANEGVYMYSRSTTAAHNGIELLRGLEYYQAHHSEFALSGPTNSNLYIASALAAFQTLISPIIAWFVGR